MTQRSSCANRISEMCRCGDMVSHLQSMVMNGPQLYSRPKWRPVRNI